jgi:hypothetical protein
MPTRPTHLGDLAIERVSSTGNRHLKHQIEFTLLRRATNEATTTITLAAATSLTWAAASMQAAAEEDWVESPGTLAEVEDICTIVSLATTAANSYADSFRSSA